MSALSIAHACVLGAWMLGPCCSVVTAAEPARFALKSVAVKAAPAASPDRRFTVHATAEIRGVQAQLPRFSLKSTLAGCAPTIEPLLVNGFE